MRCLSRGAPRIGGRNCYGRITVRHRCASLTGTHGCLHGGRRADTCQMLTPSVFKREGAHATHSTVACNCSQLVACAGEQLLLQPERRLSVPPRSPLSCLHRGGGSKRRLREVDFARRREGVEGVVERLEYDPNRTGYIALVRYPGGGREPFVHGLHLGQGVRWVPLSTGGPEARPPPPGPAANTGPCASLFVCVWRGGGDDVVRLGDGCAGCVSVVSCVVQRPCLHLVVQLLQPQ